MHLDDISNGILAGMLEHVASTMDDGPHRVVITEAIRRLRLLPNYGGAQTIPDELRRNGSPDEIIARLTEQNHQLKNALRLATNAHTP